MAATADATNHSLADHHPIGISTGVFEASRGDWPALVDEACKVSTFAVELSALSGNELPGLLTYLRAKPRLPFRYVSVHAPVKHQGLDELALVQQLGGLPLWVRSIVAHPDGLVEPDAYRALGTRLVLENMDDRKATGRIGRDGDLLPGIARRRLLLRHRARSLHRPIDGRRQRTARPLPISAPSRSPQLTQRRTPRPVAADDESLFVEILDRCRDVPWILEAPPPERWTERLGATELVAAGSSGSWALFY